MEMTLFVCVFACIVTGTQGSEVLGCLRYFVCEKLNKIFMKLITSKVSFPRGLPSLETSIYTLGLVEVANPNLLKADDLKAEKVWNLEYLRAFILIS